MNYLSIRYKNWPNIALNWKSLKYRIIVYHGFYASNLLSGFLKAINEFKSLRSLIIINKYTVYEVFTDRNTSYNF